MVALQNLAIGSALVALSFIPFVWIRRVESSMPLHEPWIAGDLVLKAKIQSPIEFTCIPRHRPLSKRLASQIPGPTGSAELDSLVRIVSRYQTVPYVIGQNETMRSVIAHIYDLAPNARLQIVDGRITCYVNDFNYRKRTPGFSLPAYKKQLKQLMTALAGATDKAFPWFSDGVDHGRAGASGKTN